MTDDELFQRAAKIADALNGAKINDVLKILAAHILFTFLQIWAQNNEATTEQEMRDYFNIIAESFHEIITEHKELLEK